MFSIKTETDTEVACLTREQYHKTLLQIVDSMEQ